MQGRRLDEGHVDDHQWPWPQMKPGYYGKDHNGKWMACTPNDLMANLSSHAVTENFDGTITVSPSILVREYEGEKIAKEWHGYLIKGVWREC